MVTTESPALSVGKRGQGPPGSTPLPTVIWLSGEHDLATVADLSITVAHASRLDDADIVVDLSEVTFMDASTVRVLVAARDFLRDHSRSLSVRAPSPQARRLLDLCGLTELNQDATPAQPPVASALASWVDVPAVDLSPDPAPPAAPATAPATAAPPAPPVVPLPQPAGAAGLPRGKSAGSAQLWQTPS